MPQHAPIDHGFGSVDRRAPKLLGESVQTLAHLGEEAIRLRFDSVEELLEAMASDVERCRELLARIVPD